MVPDWWNLLHHARAPGGDVEDGLGPPGGPPVPSTARE